MKIVNYGINIHQVTWYFNMAAKGSKFNVVIRNPYSSIQLFKKNII